MLLDYQKTILNALKDVSDSLVGYKETRERREQQAALVVSAADAVRLADTTAWWQVMRLRALDAGLTPGERSSRQRRPLPRLRGRRSR